MTKRCNVSQDGTTANDALDAMVMQSDGVLVLGYTEGDWSGSFGGYDCALAKLSFDGEEVFRWQVFSTLITQ